MATKRLVTAHVSPSKPGSRPEESQRSAEADALAEIRRAVRDDCRVDPKAYLDEVRVASSGE